MSNRPVILAILATAAVAFMLLASDQVNTLGRGYISEPGSGEAFRHHMYPLETIVVHGLIGLAVLTTLALLALMQRIALLFAWATFAAVIVTALYELYAYRPLGTPTSVEAVLLSLVVALLATHWRQVGLLKSS